MVTLVLLRVLLASPIAFRMTIRDVVEIKLFRRWTSDALSGAEVQARTIVPKCSEME